MKKNWLPLVLVIMGFVISIIAIPYLPEEMANHWNVKGEVDGYTGKWSGAFFTPIISILLLVFLQIVPKIDPKKENYKKFQGSYSLSINLIITFLLAIHVLTIGFNLGFPINISRVIPLGVGVLFICIGNYMPKFKHNYFSGIRTPWTLSSESVWNKTHRLGGKVFVVMGILIILSILFEEPVNWVIFMTSAIGGSFFLMLKSYLYFIEEQKVGK